MPYQYARLTVKFYKNVIKGNLTSRLCHSVELRMAVIAGGASAASLETCRGVPVVGQSGHAASGSEMKTRRRVVMRHLRGQGVRAPRFVCRTQAGAGIDKIGRVSSGGRGSNVSRSKGEGAAPSGGAGALRMEAVKIAQLHEGADDPNVETCRRHAASCRGEYGLSLWQHALPPVPQRKCALRTRYHSGPGVELTLRVAHEAGRSETPPPFLRNCRNLLVASSSGSGFRREGCGAEHRGGSADILNESMPDQDKKGWNGE